MSAVEWTAAALLFAGGVRSLWVWSRRRFDGSDMTDHLLYALFVTGRVGLWFAFAGLFAIYGSSDARERAFVDEVSRTRWYLIVLIALSAAQFVAGQILGRRTPARPSADPDQRPD